MITTRRMRETPERLERKSGFSVDGFSLIIAMRRVFSSTYIFVIKIGQKERESVLCSTFDFDST